MNWVQGWNGNWPYFSNFLIGVCQGVRRTRHPVSRLTPYLGGACGRLRWTEMVYRMTERCAAAWASSRGGACNHQMSVDAAEAGWSRRPRFLSLLHVNVQESPPFIFPLHFDPYTFNFVFGPNFCYISFNFVRLGPPISIDWMSKFHFGPSTFNFRIGCI